MAKIKNPFIDMNDTTLKVVLEEYEQWRNDAVIPDGGPLAEARDKYCDAYDAHGLLLLERDLLYAGTQRWLEKIEK